MPRKKGDVYLEPGPFVEWLKENYPTNDGIKDLANRSGVDDAYLRRLIRGKYKSKRGYYPVTGVSLTCVDQVLVADGNVTSIASLYPEE